jgi:CubicO group peptidase (beta-lactamase class C family)
MLLCLVSFGQYDFSALDKKFTEAKKVLGKNTVMLIYKDGKIIYKKENEDFKANSPEPIASCSKWLTAALVMTFVDQGKLSLDDKVSTYLPIFAKYGKGYITIRHCLSHQTGIQQDRVSLLSILEHRKFANLEEEVNDFASKKEIDFNPGTGFFYGGTGLNIAARVIEVIAKKSFDQLMNERILRPLNMRNTSFFNEKAINPSGGAVSAAIDYLNFLSMILNKGTFNGKRILSEQSIEEMQKNHTAGMPIKYIPKTAEGFNYGLGEWIQEADENGKSIVVSSPGLFGTWPWVDNCRGYACIIFTKSVIGESKKEIYLDLKKTIDEMIPSNCK